MNQLHICSFSLTTSVLPAGVQHRIISKKERLNNSYLIIPLVIIHIAGAFNAITAQAVPSKLGKYTAVGYNLYSDSLVLKDAIMPRANKVAYKSQAGVVSNTVFGLITDSPGSLNMPQDSHAIKLRHNYTWLNNTQDKPLPAESQL